MNLGFSHGRQVMGRFQSANPTSPRFAIIVPTSKSIIGTNRSKRNTVRFWNGMGWDMTRNMCGIRSPRWGSGVLVLLYPGRCPGLAWAAPLGLRIFRLFHFVESLGLTWAAPLELRRSHDAIRPATLRWGFGRVVDL